MSAKIFPSTTNYPDTDSEAEFADQDYQKAKSTKLRISIFSKAKIVPEFIGSSQELLSSCSPISLRQRGPVVPENIMLVRQSLELKKRSQEEFKILKNSQSEYYGKVILGQKCGYGTQYNSKGEYYEGEFLVNQYHGYGTIITDTGLVKQSYFFAGVPYSEAFFFLDDNFVIDDNNVKIYPNGAIYIGDLKDDIRQGVGKYTWSDGTYYIGQFDNDQFNGFGVMLYKNGNKYQGQWKCGLMNGIGIFKWANNEQQYLGEYKNDKKEGFGIFKWESDLKYYGFFSNGLQNGQGLIKQKGCKPKLTLWFQGLMMEE